MLGKLITKDECAHCRLCCCFESYGLWDTPIITMATAGKILQELDPEQKFVRKDGELLLRMEQDGESGMYTCPLLDKDKGCILGDEKPFDCRIWPLRVMELGGRRVIALSPLCPVVKTRPIALIQEVAKELAGRIFAYADEVPSAVRPYENGHVILWAEQL